MSGVRFGTELAFVKNHADVTLATTQEAAAVTVLTAPTLTFDEWTRVVVEFASEYVGEHAPPPPPPISWWRRLFAAKPIKRPPVPVCLNLWKDSTDVGRLAVVNGPNDHGSQEVLARYTMQVGPGSHTFSVRAWLGRGGLGRVAAPSALRVSAAAPGEDAAR